MKTLIAISMLLLVCRNSLFAQADIKSFTHIAFYESHSDSGKKNSHSRNIINDVIQYGKDYVSDGWYILTSPARLNRKNAIWLGGIIASTGLMMVYDEELIRAIDRSRGEHFYEETMKVSDKIETYGLARTMNPYYVGSAIVGYALKWEKLEKMSVQLHEALLMGALIRKAAVHLAGRTRPYERKGAYFYEFNKGTSFFSGHTTNAFEMATILSHHFNHWPVKIVSYGFASLIGLQRLHANCHWPSDVWLGAIYGTVVAKTIIKLHESRNKYATFRITPGFAGICVDYRF